MPHAREITHTEERLFPSCRPNLSRSKSGSSEIYNNFYTQTVIQAIQNPPYHARLIPTYERLSILHSNGEDQYNATFNHEKSTNKLPCDTSKLVTLSLPQGSPASFTVLPGVHAPSRSLSVKFNNISQSESYLAIGNVDKLALELELRKNSAIQQNISYTSSSSTNEYPSLDYTIAERICDHPSFLWQKSSSPSRK
ncbi:hypothetical protein AB6A40_005198 [Gnathostoma spinigerum]|uniref:Uncharacterized protein n=1 Tax=Gnathostoma spinigerum TaxID=75299 RepID=A0ABD6EK08_9BILA